MRTSLPPVDYDLGHKFEQVNSRNLGADANYNAGVYVVRRKSTGQTCVEKKYKVKDITNGTAAFEMKVLRKYKHKNIVEYLCGFIVDESHHKPRASLYLEHCDGGNLHDVMNKRATQSHYIGEQGVWDIFSQLINAVAFLQYGVRDACFRPEPPKPDWIGVLHRDIKPDNIFLILPTGDGYPRIVLGDFGQGIMINDDGKWGRQYMIGNQATAPPEVNEGGLCAYTFAGDAYAVGRTMVFVCTFQFQEDLLGAAAGVYSTAMANALDCLMQYDRYKRPRMDDFGSYLPEWRDQGLTYQSRRKAQQQNYLYAF
ncbi:MAG: hypothetical protein L6R40_007674 [Gallowayella cf. fulva]|nr:MAG: hypothetical protein L6R40_007674 [Xanthomendoza cf. fulva]